MAPKSSVGGRVIPDQRHLAFAVCIVSSKPEALTIEEYISLLRQHVAKGRRENALSSVYRHLDRSSYWRSEYERVKQDYEAADNERLDLKVEVDRLKAEVEAARPTGPSKKRKKQENEDSVPVSRPSKTAKQSTAEASSSLTAGTVAAGFNFSHLGEPGDMLMRSFYQAHALFKSHDRTEPALLAQHLTQAANAVSAVLRKIPETCLPGVHGDSDHLKTVLNAISRAFQSLLGGYARVSNVSEGHQVQGQLVYAYVQIFEASTSLIDQFAEFEATRLVNEASAQAARPSTSKGKAKQIIEPPAKQKKIPTLTTLASFITGMMGLIDAKTVSHKPHFEGLAYVLIEKLASCLYTVVFGRPRGLTMEEEIAAAAQADEIEEPDGEVKNKPEDVVLKAARLEAPYLIQLLTRLMQVAPAHFGAAVTTKTGKAKVGAKTAPSKDNLAITAKERLQRTLVNCMFGTEGVDEEDPFLDCLQKPVQSGTLPSVPMLKEVDVQDWFKEEVWRLLGWDILSREGGW